jgi:hypothetical protein
MTASPPDAAAGMPSEEALAELLRTYGEFGTTTSRERQQSGECARAVLSLIRPAFEAKERMLETSREAGFAMYSKHAEAEARALSAEAKLREANMQALSDEGQMRDLQAKLAQAVEARENDAVELDQWAYEWLISLRPETDERATYKDGYFSGATHVLGKVRDRARMIADVDAVAIRNEERPRLTDRGEKT